MACEKGGITTFGRGTRGKDSSLFPFFGTKRIERVVEVE
jgi:hypothetical protein